MEHTFSLKSGSFTTKETEPSIHWITGSMGPSQIRYSSKENDPCCCKPNHPSSVTLVTELFYNSNM